MPRSTLSSKFRAGLLSSLAVFLPLLLGTGCGVPGVPPLAPVAPQAASFQEIDAQKLLAEAPEQGVRVGWHGEHSYRLSSAGAWKVIFFDPPLRSFQVKPPAARKVQIRPPEEVLFFSEGKDRVVLRPSGAPHMAFHFQVPEGMRPVPPRKVEQTPLHFPDADVWVFRAGQILTLEWDQRRIPGWLGITPCFDASGARIPVTGSLHLPEGWVGVPTGNPIFRVGKDRAYGPFRKIRPGMWTATEDPLPLAAHLLSGVLSSIESVLGPAPRTIPNVILESCGSCARDPDEVPVEPRGESDEEVSWIRLGTPGLLADRPGPLQTEPLKRWIPVEDGDPTAQSLVNLYARILFPTEVFQGISFLPPPSLSASLEELIRTWRNRASSWESRNLVDTVLPGILFECREANRQGFDQAIRVLISRGRAPTFHDLVELLRLRAPESLTPLRLRGLVQ